MEKTEEIMKTKDVFGVTRTALLLGLCLSGAALGLFGCQNTAEGVATDAKKDTAVVGNAADKAADATKMAANNAGDALSLTPKVKAAIVADATLNNPKNLIDVDTKNDTVTLKGHVLTNDMKKSAGAIATKTVTDAGSKDKVMNMLTVETH